MPLSINIIQYIHQWLHVDSTTLLMEVLSIFEHPRPTVKDSFNSKRCEGSSRIRKRAFPGPPSLTQCHERHRLTWLTLTRLRLQKPRPFSEAATGAPIWKPSGKVAPAGAKNAHRKWRKTETAPWLSGIADKPCHKKKTCPAFWFLGWWRSPVRAWIYCHTIARGPRKGGSTSATCAGAHGDATAWHPVTAEFSHHALECAWRVVYSQSFWVVVFHDWCVHFSSAPKPNSIPTHDATWINIQTHLPQKPHPPRQLVVFDVSCKPLSAKTPESQLQRPLRFHGTAEVFLSLIRGWIFEEK